MANDRFATGRPATVDPVGGANAVVSGHSERMVEFRAIARTSSRTKTPRKLVEYAQTPAARIRTTTPKVGTARAERRGSSGFVRLRAARRLVDTDTILAEKKMGPPVR
jgi:hypothetical protein